MTPLREEYQNELVGVNLRRARFTLVLHTSHYSRVKKPDYTACHPEKATTYETLKKNAYIHVVPTTTHTHVGPKSTGKKRREKKIKRKGTGEEKKRKDK